MSDISQMLGRESQTELMVAGITHLNGIAEAIRAGVDIVAVPPAFLQPMASHRRTDELVKELAEQFEAWRRSVDAGPGGRRPASGRFGHGERVIPRLSGTYRPALLTPDAAAHR